VWPWYSQIAPLSWLLANDVKEGRRELNFSKWSTYDAKRRAKKLTEIAKEVGEGEMPPWYYVLVHSDAKLAGTDRDTVRVWTLERPVSSPADRTRRSSRMAGTHVDLYDPVGPPRGISQ
jgi:hypothetical protein